MSDPPRVGELVLPVDAAVLAALHGKACVVCGATGGPLCGAGYVYTLGRAGSRLGWPVLSCPTHCPKAAAR
jgi:hypothetical protein